jgi:phosphosulfolactate phosphohydrolase-like enzyme
LNIQKDVKYCLTLNTIDTIPVLEEGALIRLQDSKLAQQTV